MAKGLGPLLLLGGAAALAIAASKKKPTIPEDYLNGYFAQGATVSAAEGLMDIEKMVTLRNIVMRDADGNMHDAAEATFYPATGEPGNEEGGFSSASLDEETRLKFFGMGPVIGRVVTNFYGPGGVAFEGEVMDEFIEGPISADPADPESAPAVAIAVLQRLRPLINWSLVKKGTVEGMVRDGAVVIAQIVHQNLPGA